MDEVYLVNLTISENFDNKVQEHLEFQMKENRKSLWKSDILDSMTVTVYNGNNDYSQIMAIDENETVVGGEWDLIDLMWTELDFEFVAVLMKSKGCYKSPVEFNTNCSILFDRAMMYHAGKYLTKRAQNLLKNGNVFLLWDAQSIVYIEEGSVMCLRWENNELNIGIQGNFPFVSKKGFVKLGDVMFYVPPETVAQE